MTPSVNRRIKRLNCSRCAFERTSESSDNHCLAPRPCPDVFDAKIKNNGRSDLARVSVSVNGVDSAGASA